MPINVGKNLKISPTNDTKISRFVRDYSDIHDTIVSEYPDTSQPVMLSDILEILITKYTLSYSELPTGATFIWKYGSTTLTNPCELPAGCVVSYELTYSDDSKSVGSFVVSDNFELDLSTLEPNQFLVTITSDKTISYLNVTRYKGTPEQTSYSVTTFDDNTYSFYANDNESISLFPLCSDYTYSDKSLNNNGHSYNYTITQNTQCNALFPYVAWRAYNIALKDDNGQEITNISQYWDDIVISGDSSKIEYKRESFSSYFAIWTYPNTTFDYTININGYSPISDTGCTAIDIRVYKTLVPYYTYTLTPIPSDATVTLAASGYQTVSGVGTQSITVEKGTTVLWMVSKEDYITRSDNITITSNLSETKTIEERNYKVNIDDYEYTFENGGSGTTPTTPGLENI